MWSRWRKGPYYKPTLGSIGLHVGLFLFLSLNWLFSPSPQIMNMLQLNAENQPDIIQATAVSEQQYDKEVQQIDKAQKAQAKAKQKETKAKEEAAKQKQIEEQKIEEAKIKEKQEAEEKLAQEKTKEKQIAEEQKKQEEAKKVEQEKVAKEKSDAQKLEAEAKEKKLAEDQKKIDAEKLAAEKTAQAKEKQEAAAEAERVRQQQLLADQQAQAAQQQSRITSELSRYQSLITQKIASVWSVPLGATASQKVRLMVRLAPDGTVLSAHITQSSGNAALDQSAYAAVLKASPLPVPSDFAVFNQMRELDIILTPQV